MMPITLNLALPVAAPAAGLTDALVAPDGSDAFMQLLAQLTGIEADPVAQPAVPDAATLPLELSLKAPPQIGLGTADEDTEEAPQDGDEPEAGTTQPPQLAALMALLSPTPMPASAAPATVAPPADPAVSVSPAVVIANAAPAVIAKPLKSPAAASPAVPADIESAPVDITPMPLPEAVRALPVAQPEIHIPKALRAAPADHAPETALPSDLPTLTVVAAPSLDIVGNPMPAPAPVETAPVGEASPVHDQVEAQLDLARDGEWLDRLAKDIARTAGEEGGRLRFRLNPETLGTLHVELSRGSAGTSIRLTADTAAAQAIIADAQPRLIAEARAQGVRVAETHVDLSGGTSTSADARDQRGASQEEIVRTFSVVETDETPAPRVVRSASERYA